MAESLRYVPQLDGIRGLAIGLVLLWHLPVVIGRDLGPLQPLAAAGWTGVDVFFALSGFLITRILLSTVGRPYYLRNFYVRRGLRILPLYYGVLALVFIARFSTPGVSSDATPSPLWFFGFVSNFWYATKPAATDLTLEVMWSLSVEEQFYLVWPLLVCWLSRRGLVVTLVGMIVVAPVCRLLVVEDLETMGYTFCRMDGLALGCLAALWSVSPRRSVPHHLGRVAGGLWIALTIIVCLGAFRQDGWGMPTIEYALVPAITAVTILAVLSDQTCLLSRLLGLRPLVWVGSVSFGLYLLHPLCFSMTRSLAVTSGWQGNSGGWPADVVLAVVSIVLSLLVAGASYYCFERHFLNLKDRLAPSGHSASVAVPHAVAPHA